VDFSVARCATSKDKLKGTVGSMAEGSRDMTGSVGATVVGADAWRVGSSDKGSVGFV